MTNSPEHKSEATPAITVEDKRNSAPGSIPKNVQSWLLLGVALLIVLVVTFSGGAKKATTVDPGTKPPAVEGMTPEQIASTLDRENKLAALNAQPVPQYVPGQKSPSANQTGEESGADSDAIAADAQKRAYESLFASNVALSYRLQPNESALEQPFGSSAASAGESLFDSPPVPYSGPQLYSNSQQAGPTDPLSSIAGLPKAAANKSPITGPGPAAAPSSRNNIIHEGTVLETVLVNRLVGDFSGPVVCMVTNPIYSPDRQNVLVPPGSKVIGEAKQVTAFGQQRLAVAFHRLILPDGHSISLQADPGLDQVGETALHDKVNNHYFKIFGASMAIGAISGLSGSQARLTPYGTPASMGSVYEQGISSNLSKSSLQVLSKFLNLLPTITIREGHRVKVYLIRDLVIQASQETNDDRR